MNKEIYFTKKFKRRYKQLVGNLGTNIKNRIEERVDLFLSDRNSPILSDHRLQGRQNKLRAFRITGDVRIVYQEFSDHYSFLDIGTHNQVY
jgi:addiction module RelE/StbE family toxin